MKTPRINLTKRGKPKGVLIVEAVVAAFLMIFAFAASTALFHGALQWEAQGSNVRRASMVAEKKVGEIRAWSETYHRTRSFDQGWTAPITGPQADYLEAPGFQITVKASLPEYRRILHTNETPPDGMYSPTSHFYDQAAFQPVPAFPADFPDNRQVNPTYGTFSYVRGFNSSFRQVEVTVKYSNSNREFRLVTLVGDPLPRANPAVSFTRVSGSGSLSGGQKADYRVNITGPGGRVLDDIVCIWGVDLARTTGAVRVQPKDANAREVRVFHDVGSSPGVVYLSVRFRYRGRQYTTYSDPFDVS